MRVAIAGSGDVTRYLSEEFVAEGIEVVILSRSKKPQYENRPGVHQFVSDYTLPSLLKGIEGCTTVISTILDYTQAFVDVNLLLIEAATQTPSVKRFIPAEYGGNLEDFPDQPGFYWRKHEPIRKVLREQSELEWTLVSTGWLNDYIVPTKNRYMKDIDDAFPINIKTKKIEIPGSGKEFVDFTTARDMARAMAKLVQAPKWEPYTYMSGEKTTWNDFAAVMKEKYPDMTVTYRSLYQLIEDLRNAKDDEEYLITEYKVFSPSGAGSLPADKVAEHRERYFKGIHFRTAREFLEESEKRPDAIL